MVHVWRESSGGKIREPNGYKRVSLQVLPPAAEVDRASLEEVIEDGTRAESPRDPAAGSATAPGRSAK